MKKKLGILFAILLVFYLIALCMMYCLQRCTEYQPEIKTESQFLSAAEEIKAKVIKYKSDDDLDLYGLYYPPKSGYPLFLYFNGHSGSIEEAYVKLKPLIDLGYGVFINIYRGFESNPGSPSETDIFADAEIVYKWLQDYGYKEDRIIIYGYSLGSGVAVYLSSRNSDSKALIIESGFSSAADVVGDLFPCFPMGILLKDKYKSDKYIKTNFQPKLFMHGDMDLRVNPEFGKKLYEVAPNPKQFILFQGGSHKNLHTLGSTEAVIEFVKDVY